ncbi:MAG: hypothetical protein ACFFA4_06410 [Promethearchaeota archaeon]
MRKSIPILVCLLGIFFFIPFINFSRALPPSYIGVQTGEQYTWTLRINANTFAQYATDTGQPIPPEFSMFETMGGIQVRGTVAWISDEYIDIFNYVIINLTIAMYVPGYGWMEYPEPGNPTPLPIIVLSNETSNYFNNTLNAMGSITLPPPISFALPFLIVPHNLNWTDAILGLNELFQGFTGGMTGITIEEFGRGFKVTIPEQLVNSTVVKQTEYIAQWNEKGVFGQGQVLYGGATLMAVNVPEAEIPGFEITILVSVLGISTIGLVYYIKKRK